MKRLRQHLKIWLAPGATALVTTTFLVLSISLLCGAEPQSTENGKSAPKPEKKKQLTGAELYAINCNRCHPERYPTEFTSSQWKTILTHMRVRANLPAKQAKKILKYLQEDSGS